MNVYNKCEGCKLWDGHHCTGARSYEPNAEEHRIICNEHLAKQFWIVYQQLNKSLTHINKLKEKLNIANKTIDGLKVYIKEMNKLLDKMKGKINE